jgi:hypothetical protein
MMMSDLLLEPLLRVPLLLVVLFLLPQEALTAIRPIMYNFR